jgi:hypothetical protein
MFIVLCKLYHMSSPPNTASRRSVDSQPASCPARHEARLGSPHSPRKTGWLTVAMGQLKGKQEAEATLTLEAIALHEVERTWFRDCPWSCRRFWCMWTENGINEIGRGALIETEDNEQAAYDRRWTRHPRR